MELNTTMMGQGPKMKTKVSGRVRPIHDGVLAMDMEFGERTTKGGIILSSDDGKERGIRPRWCQIYAIGHENKDPYEVGDWIYVEHGRWSRGFITDDPEHGEVELRLIDVNGIMLTSKDKPDDDGMGTETDLSQPSIDPSEFVRA
jgi:co-chaperonin GroES (HSP10)|tara:strand:+ start:14619 stop:15053 length:435 start_codon:yes stop_codon:yes gene_type:complete